MWRRLLPSVHTPWLHRLGVMESQLIWTFTRAVLAPDLRVVEISLEAWDAVGPGGKWPSARSVRGHPLRLQRRQQFAVEGSASEQRVALVSRRLQGLEDQEEV